MPVEQESTQKSATVGVAAESPVGGYLPVEILMDVEKRFWEKVFTKFVETSALGPRFRAMVRAAHRRAARRNIHNRSR